MSLEKIVIENGIVITPHKKIENENEKITRVVIENREIVFAGLEESNEENDKKYEHYTNINASGKIVSPGFIDSHVHINPNFEETDEEHFYDLIQNKSLEFLKQGVTGYMLATMAMSDTKLEDMLSVIDRLREIDNGSELLGAVIEGTFINRDMAGAMNTQYIFSRSKGYLDYLSNKFKSILKKIVLAPEVNPDYYDFIRETRNREDIVLSMGHSNASYEQAIKVVNEGVRVINHFFNRVSQFQQRDIGIVGAIFSSPEVKELFLELIVDKKHICKEAIGCLTEIIEKIHKKNWEDIVMLITDAINVIAPDERDMETGYMIKRIGDKKIYFIDGAPYLDKEKRTLYGSILTMRDSVNNMISLGYEPLKVIKSATLTSAKAHRLDKKGSIEKGKDADIVIFDKIDEEECRLGDVKCVFVKGSKKYLSDDFQSRIERK